jgi:hypothetical protein
MSSIKRNAIFSAVATALLLVVSVAHTARARQSQNSPPPPAQQQQPQQQAHGSMPGMDMDDTPGASGKNSDAAQSANDAMSGEHMDMGAHMFMTALRPENPADDQRAAAIVVTVREAINKYKDYKVALADGFRIFLPNVPQPIYHFTNSRYTFEARFAFDPSHPGSLLYKKTAGGYELVGAMFTAGKNATEDELNARVPLSVARWHRHINFCLPRISDLLQGSNPKPQGFWRSISTEDACAQAGGRWYPQIFGWMVHVYPYESDPSKIWAH